MKFDRLANIVINEGKQKTSKFANLEVGNANPVFRPEDILRDPTDPSKGTKLYLGGVEAKKKGLEPGDPQSIRRQLRRVNWVAKKLIKKYQNRQSGVPLEKLSDDIREMLERYQTQVLGWNKPDKANTGYETRVIGNLLLPPTKRTPQAKSVFIVPGMDPNAGPEAASKPVKTRNKKTKEVSTVSADDLLSQFDQIMDRRNVLDDPDLREVIEDIASRGGTVRDILSDPRIEDQFDPQHVRDAIRGMIKSDILSKDGEGVLTLNTDYEDGHRGLAAKIRGAGSREIDVDDIEDVDVDDIDVAPDTPEDEEDIEIDTTKPAGDLKSVYTSEDEDEESEYLSSDEDEEEAADEARYVADDEMEEETEYR